MKRQRIFSSLLSFLIAALVALPPVAVYAEGAVATPPPSLAPILISEIQPGSATSASEEFIEIYNTTGLAIDLSAHSWQLELASTTATNWASPFRTITLNGIIAPGQSYVVASQFSSGGQAVQYLPGVAHAWFGAGLSAAAGHARLLYSANQLQSDGTCSAAQTVVDEVEWSAPKNGGAATPSVDSRSVFVTPKSGGIPAGSSLQRLVDPVFHIYTDSDNDALDFSLNSTPAPAVGSTAAAATSPIVWQPSVPLPSDDCDPNPPAYVPGDNGDTANPLDPPAAGNPGNQGLLSPEITELLPNPVAPQTDANDEFVELYNPNDTVFDLSGFTLKAGAETTHDYTFPNGTLLQPKSFTAFFSGDTHLSLANSGGQVSLIDPPGNIIAQSDAYATAKDGQAWVLVGGSWQWTTSPTPNAPNIAAEPAPAADSKKPVAVTAAKSAAKKPASSVKAASTKTAAKPKAKSKAPKTASGQALAANTTAAKSSLHPGILAGVGVLAVLYGAYEYRHDMANYFRRLRENRAARRKIGQAATRRGGD